MASANRIKPADLPAEKLPEDVKESILALKPGIRRFHGVKIPLYWFPFPWLSSACADRFGYMSSAATRAATKLPFNVATQALLGQLGNMMGDPGRDPNPASHNPADAGVSSIPAGFTYFGQFVDHDITFDVSSTLDANNDANMINNMRSPALDLESVYGRGPGLDPFLYVFPTSGPTTAIKLHRGTNTPIGPGGPSNNGNPSGMVQQTSWDVPRMQGTNTAAIGDPRNDENLIIVQFQHAMLRFHNAVVDLLVAVAFAGDIFAEAKRIVTHHYQWAVVHDFLKRICGVATVNNAMASVSAPIGSSFRMPVEFAVAAYRFGHSMIRDAYWVNFNFPEATLEKVFEFNRDPRLPVFSTWVVDFNAFFDTGVPVPVHNKARKIDSFMANGLESLPGFSGMMAILATRNLRRALALGLPSGQGMANSFGIAPMTAAQLTSGVPVAETAVLNSSGGLLLNKTPLWYYVLREASVLAGGNQLGPVGGRIVAETFVRILKRDASSYLNVAGGFTPILPSSMPGDFTVADLVAFAGVTQP
ncbi:heme peroxidase family protein [Mesorhizobium sp. M5C.F.Ca.IN.020.29.1.1]|uniref:peroxidase family protein n=1 Tax=Mesorhizobium sp. M5C.F.Ca.IN.020.29.1.1 TaxID=2496770 RepID=UPI001FDED342|nr:heme peroxidase family protein [Mesorhizobium sp. M5C.F.Ca.IN.020.29.1.1]